MWVNTTIISGPMTLLLHNKKRGLSKMSLTPWIGKKIIINLELLLACLWFKSEFFALLVIQVSELE